MTIIAMHEDNYVRALIVATNKLKTQVKSVNQLVRNVPMYAKNRLYVQQHLRQTCDHCLDPVNITHASLSKAIGPH